VTDPETGKVKYEYYSLDITIHFILPTGDEGNESWEFSMLDIGTLVRDEQGNLGAIYKFRDAAGKNEIATAPVKYGTIDELMAQRAKWDKSDMANFPYEEITEPMPLRGGKLYIDAINSTDGSIQYDTIDGIDSRPASWNSFDLPSKR
jgi:hypothetical protein